MEISFLYSTLVFTFCLLAHVAHGETTIPNCIVASSKESIEMVMKIVAANDIDALKKLVEAHQAAVVPESIEVQVTERDGQYVKIRPLGETYEVWTVARALKE